MTEHIAFDWGGVLSDRPTVWDIARALYRNNVKVSIISWCGPNDGPLSVEGKLRIAESGIAWSAVVGFDSAPEVTLAITADGKAEYQIGLAKAAHMRRIGATAIFDDNPYIVRAVQDSGLLAFQVIR